MKVGKWEEEALTETRRARRERQATDDRQESEWRIRRSRQLAVCQLVAAAIYLPKGPSTLCFGCGFAFGSVLAKACLTAQREVVHAEHGMDGGRCLQ